MAPPIDLQAIELALVDLPGLGAILKAVAATVNALTAAVDTQAKANQQLRAKVDELTTKVGNLETRLEDTERKAITETEKVRQEVRQELVGVRRQAAEQSAKIAVLTRRVEGQEARLDRQAEEIDALKQTVAQLQNQIQVHDERLDAHDIRLAAHDDVLAAHDDRLGLLDQRVTALELVAGVPGAGGGPDGWLRLPIYSGPGAEAGGRGSAAPGGDGWSLGSADALVAVSATASLTGQWVGHYQRLDNGASTAISLDLVQRESAVVGTSAEPVTVDGAAVDTAQAYVLGQTWMEAAEGGTRQALGFSAIYAGTGGMLGTTLHVGVRENNRIVGKWYSPKANLWVLGGSFELHAQE